MSNLVYNNNSNNLKIELPGNAAAHLFPVAGVNSEATKMYRYQSIVPAPAIAATAQAAIVPTTITTMPTLATTTEPDMPLAASGCGKVRKYGARSALNNMSDDDEDMNINGNNTHASFAARVAPYNIDQSQSVQRRNARERNRVKQVNNSFARLRQHIPQSIIADLTKGGGRGPQKKISKVDTLRIAVEYIRRLQDLVEDLNGSAANNGVAVNPNLSAAAAALLPTTSALNSNSNSSHAGNLLITTNYYANNNSNTNSNSLTNTPPPASLTTTPPQPQLMLSNTSSPQHNGMAISALQQQQQLTRQQYPNHPLTPISLNAYSPPPATAAAPAASMTLSTQTQLDQQVACHSPTSSYNSSMSFDSGTFEAAPQQLSPLAINIPQQQQQQFQQHQQQQQHQQLLQTQSHLPTNVLELPHSQHIAAINQTQLNEHHAHLQLKFEQQHHQHEHFNLDDDDCTPDDEEILDYISLWQEQ